MIFSQKKTSFEQSDHINVFLPSQLKMYLPPFFLKNNLNFEIHFPDRVEQNQIIFKYRNFHFRSPLSGIISYGKDENNSHYFLLKIMGRNQIFNFNYSQKTNLKEDYKDNIENVRKLFLERLDKNGVYVFEYHQILSEIIIHNKKIVFLLTDNLVPQIWKKLFYQLREEIEILESILIKAFSYEKVEFTPSLRSFFKKSYTETKLYRYEYIRYLYNLKEKEIIVLNPTTLLAILNAIFFDEPFTKNLMIFQNYKSHRFFYAFFYHGTDILDAIRDKNLKFYLDDLKEEELILRPFNIYDNYIYHIQLKKNTSLCTLCFGCNNFCPVDANPMSLFDNPKYFKKDKCIECGICDEVCESLLDIRSRIKKEKSIINEVKN